MPIIPTILERLIFFRLNKGPGPLFDMMSALAFRAISAALELGVFEALELGPLSCTELAQSTNTDERGLRALLLSLEPLGYVRQQGELFANTDMTRTWMLKGSPQSLVDLFRYTDNMLQRWEDLEDSIRAGAPVRTAAQWFQQHPEGWEAHHGGMRAAARLLAPQVVKLLRLPGSARRLLDLGGSHGEYSAAFCAEHPQLQATILDRAEARDLARTTIAEAGQADRVSFEEGDFITGELGQGFDVVLLFNVMRIFTPEQNQQLLGKVAGALNQGGQVFIMDQLGHSAASSFSRANARLVELELFNATQGRIYTPDEVMEILGHAGFSGRRQRPLPRSPGLGLVTATR